MYGIIVHIKYLWVTFSIAVHESKGVWQGFVFGGNDTQPTPLHRGTPISHKTEKKIMK